MTKPLNIVKIPTEKSFASHPKSQFWSYEKNNGAPTDYALNSHKKFWFNCDCGHQFESNLLNINKGNNWCPYCSNHVMRLCENNDCKRCFENSFANNPKAVYWSSNNELNPRQVFKATDKKFDFNCICGHKINIALKNISRSNHWCSYCTHQKLCDNDECIMCFENSFASIEKSNDLHDKSINPRTLFKSTNKKFKFDCDDCNSVFETQLSDITRGVGCPYCVNKTELILHNKLIINFPLLRRQYKVDWCKNKHYLPFDFVIEDLKIIIELDGKQHFEQTSNWASPEENRKNDLYKMKCANENRFSVIRILQKDVYKNKYDWLSDLISNIEKIRNENAIQNIYMCKNNEYKDYI